MKEQFVDIETSKMLKEDGFDKPCLAYFVCGGSDLLKDIKLLPASNLYGNNKICHNHELNYYMYSAPLWQQVEGWLWEDHKIYIELKNKHFASVFEYKVIRGYINPKKVLFKETEQGASEAKIEGIKIAVKYLCELNKKLK